MLQVIVLVLVILLELFFILLNENILFSQRKVFEVISHEFSELLDGQIAVIMPKLV